RPSKTNGLSGRQSKAAIFNQQVIVARREINMTTEERFLVVRFSDRQAAAFGQIFTQATIEIFTAVLRDDDRQREFRRQTGQKRLQCFQSAGGSSDNDNVEYE